MAPFLICLLLSLSLLFSARSQRYSYTDREIRFDKNREQVKIVLAPNELLHVWKYGLSGVSVNVYTRNLEYITTQNLSHQWKNVSFIRYTNFYYAILSDSNNVAIYYIEKDGKYTRKTKTPEIRHLTAGRFHSYYFRQGTSSLFLIKQINELASQKTLLDITAVDSSLNYVNKITLEVEYIKDKPQATMLASLDNQLILLNNTISNGAEVLAVTKIDVVNSTFVTKLFHPEGLQFISNQLLRSGNDIILQSQVTEFMQKEGRPKVFTYFIRMNKELETLNAFYLNSPRLNQFQNLPYLYKPVVTVPLQNKELLAIDFGRREQKKSTGPEEVLRYISLDSNFTVTKVINQPANKGRYNPSFLLIKEKRLHVFYEEVINSKIKLINSYEIGDSLVNDKPLLLNPNFSYELKQSIPIGEAVFIMPYIHNFRLGLVKVNMGND